MEESIGEIKNTKPDDQEALNTQTLPNTMGSQRNLSKISTDIKNTVTITNSVKNKSLMKLGLLIKGTLFIDSEYYQPEKKSFRLRKSTHV